jgi:hypothetical protein
MNMGLIQKILMSIPLILSFFLILGLKSSVNLPISLEANWVFRLTDEGIAHPYREGLRKGIILLVLLPLFVVFGLLYMALWGASTAWLHSGFGFVVSILNMEILFYRYRKIPFACSFLPGKEKIQLYWIPYVLMFLIYIIFSQWLEIRLMIRPVRFLTFLIVSMVIWIIIRISQRHKVRNAEILYDEQPVPVLLTLNSTE